jgi:glycerol kinase
VRSAIAETTALGAAYLAGLGVGFWPDLEDISSRWHAGRTFEPRMTSAERDDLYAGWQRAIELAKGWARD